MELLLAGLVFAALFTAGWPGGRYGENGRR